jgi:hypothetical protein
MTKDEFNTTVSLIIDGIGPDNDQERDNYYRILAAVGFFCRQVADVPDDVEVELVPDKLPKFLLALTRRQRRLLKDLADSLKGGPEYIH